MGLVWSVPVSSKEYERASTNRGGAERGRKRIIGGGGSTTVFGEGFYSEKSGCPWNSCPQNLVLPPPLPKRAQNEEKLHKSVEHPRNEEGAKKGQRRGQGGGKEGGKGWGRRGEERGKEEGVIRGRSF